MTTSTHQQVSKEILLRRVFTDSKHYPYGFSRSGDFSIAESKALSAYGCYFAALADGELKATSDEEFQFINAVHGLEEPQDTAQRAWLKYQKRINRPKTGSIYGTGRQHRSNNSEDDSEIESDLEDDISIDIDD